MISLGLGGRRLGIGGVTGLFQSVAPSLVVGYFQIKQECVPVPVSQEVGVVLEGLGCIAVFAEAGFPRVVVLFIVCGPFPVVVTLDAEVVVGLDGQVGVAVP